MAISAVAYRNQLAGNENRFFSLFTKNRGKTLAGYGGTLAGYNTSLIQKQAELTDELMQKKYDNGEISLADLTAYLKKTLSRSWLSIEEKRLVSEQINSLQTVEKDKVIDAQYKAGQITARDVANYQTNKLLTMTPGTEGYVTQQANIAQWEKEAGKEDIEKFESSELARVSTYLNDPVTYYTELQKVYQTLSSQAQTLGLVTEANNYTIKAAQAGQSLQSQQATVDKTNAQNTKDQIVNEFNLAVNDYHDNTISGQDLLAKIDTLERQAIQSGDTDLLDNFNQWVDYVNEDLLYGKAASRGGSRRGTGSSAADTGWDAEDEMFASDIKMLQEKFMAGEIPTQDYTTYLATALQRRKQTLDSRISELDGLDDTDKVIYEGSKSSVSTVRNKLETEMNENWGRTLGWTAAQSGKVGLDPLLADIETNGGQYVPVVSTTGTGPGATPKLDLVDISLVGSDYVQDDKGRYWKIQNQKTGRSTISGAEYNALLESDPMAANDYTPQIDANGNITAAQSKKITNVNYVDIYGTDGSRIRYFIDASGKIVDYTPDIKNQPSNVKDILGGVAGFQSPDTLLAQLNEATASAGTTQPIAGQETRTTPTGDALSPYKKAMGVIKGILPGVKPAAQVQQPEAPRINIPAGTTIRPEESQQIIETAKQPAVSGPSTTVVGSEGIRAAEIKNSPTMLTPPGSFTQTYKPLADVFAGQKINVAAPPISADQAKTNYEAANQKLLSQVEKAKQPTAWQKTKSFISSIFNR